MDHFVGAAHQWFQILRDNLFNRFSVNLPKSRAQPRWAAGRPRRRRPILEAPLGGAGSAEYLVLLMVFQ